MGKLTDRVAIITGGASGIGAAMADLFSSEGARIAIGDLDATLGTSKADAITEAGGHAICVEGDVSTPAGATRLVDAAVAEFGRIDVLVNNAGIYRNNSVAEMPVEEWDRILEVNLRGTFLCSRAAIGALVESGRGTIVNIGSRAGNRGEAFGSAYAASKAGVIALTRSLAGEIKGTGARINVICPGMVRTSMGADAVVIPGERWVEPEEIARVALFLACDDSTALQGAVLDAYG